MLQLTRRQLLQATALGGAAFALTSCSGEAPVEQVDTSGPPRSGGTLRVDTLEGRRVDRIRFTPAPSAQEQTEKGGNA